MNPRASRAARMVFITSYLIGALTLLLLAAGNYPVQWRMHVNNERVRYLEVYDQAIEYYYLDHEGVLPPLPDQPSVIANRGSCSYFCRAQGSSLPCYDMQPSLVPGYMQKLLRDPLLDSDVNSGFYIHRTAGADAVVIGLCDSFFGRELRVEHRFAEEER